MNNKVMEAKKELATERLRREEETVQYEQRVTLLESERLHFHEEKNKIEEAAKRVNQQNYGQEKLIQIEVTRRLEIAIQEMKKPASAAVKRFDEDEKALRAFMNYRETYQIDYERVDDEDVLVDAMEEADNMELKKLLMRYRRLKNEAQQRDPRLTNRIVRNYFSCIRKVGVLLKKQESAFFDSWDSRFVVLTNAGLLYFGKEQLKTEKDLVP